LVYLVNISVFPKFDTTHVSSVIFWASFHSLLELIVFFSQRKGLGDYFDFFNILDISRIALQVLYVFQTQLEHEDSIRATTFSFLMFVSILGLLNVLRYYEIFRNLIDLILSCAIVVNTFTVVFMIMIMAFTAAEYYRDVINAPSESN
jgi:hypothetical protein